jgi:hypothetical protein
MTAAGLKREVGRKKRESTRISAHFSVKPSDFSLQAAFSAAY